MLFYGKLDYVNVKFIFGIEIKVIIPIVYQHLNNMKPAHTAIKGSK